MSLLHDQELRYMIMVSKGLRVLQLDILCYSTFPHIQEVGYRPRTYIQEMVNKGKWDNVFYIYPVGITVPE